MTEEEVTDLLGAKEMIKFYGAGKTSCINYILSYHNMVFDIIFSSRKPCESLRIDFENHIVTGYSFETFPLVS